MEKLETIQTYPHKDSYWPLWLSWRRTSFLHLLTAEANLFKYIKNKCILSFEPITKGTQYLRTVFSRDERMDNNAEYNKREPIVLVHGLGAGIGLWCKNIDGISKHRRLYAMDVLGFAFSSRPLFPENAEETEAVLVDSLEDWRQSVGLDRFVLLGHSLGGYLAYAYALRHPNRVSHLILAEPWGFAKYNPERLSFIQKSLFRRFIFYCVNSFTPLALLRFAGPMGPNLMIKFRSDLGLYFEGKSNLEDPNNISVNSRDVFDYIYHCNAQNPSGEIAFRNLSLNVGWAQNPMVDRIDQLDKRVPISFIYGKHSWMESSPGEEFKNKRPDSYVDVQLMLQCGHHVYAEDSDDFNDKVNKICRIVDKDCDLHPNDEDCQKSNKEI